MNLREKENEKLLYFKDKMKREGRRKRFRRSRERRPIRVGL